MIIDKPCDWVIDRLKSRRPFFSVRYNDGEMAMMYRTMPEGKVIGTDANPAPCNYELGDELRTMLTEILVGPYSDDVLIGHCCRDDPNDSLNQRFWADHGFGINGHPEAGGHWPLDGVVDGSTVRMLSDLGEGENCVHLITCVTLAGARHCIGASTFLVSEQDSYRDREEVYEGVRYRAKQGDVFVWAGGVGLKPTAWRLFKEFPQSSHIDVGHLFNGAFGLRDYGWLQRQDGPWYEPYFRKDGFADWVRSFIK